MSRVSTRFLSLFSQRCQRMLADDRPTTCFDARQTLPLKPLVIGVDNSGSTSRNGAIAEFNHGTQNLVQELRRDSFTARQVRIRALSFGGGVAPLTDGFAPVHQFDARPLRAAGHTPLAEAILVAIADIRDLLATARELAVEMQVADAVFLSDGLPTDSAATLELAKIAMLQCESEGCARFHAFYVAGCDPAKLNALFPRPAQLLQLHQIAPAFASISKSIRIVSRRTCDHYDLQSEVADDLLSDPFTTEDQK